MYHLIITGKKLITARTLSKELDQIGFESLTITYDEKKEQLHLITPSEAVYQNIFSICGGVISHILFIDEINKKLTDLKCVASLEFIEHLLQTCTKLDYFSVLTYKNLIQYLGSNTALDLDSFTTFRLDQLRLEMSITVDDLLRTAQLNTRLNQVDSLDALNEILTSFTDELLGVEACLPIFSKLYDFLIDNPLEALHIRETRGVLSLQDENHCTIDLASLLHLLHHEITLLTPPIDNALQSFIQELIVITPIVKPTTIYLHTKGMCAENKQAILAVLGEMKKGQLPFDLKVIS